MDKEKLIDKIKNLQGLTNDEKADLLGLLRSFKKYGLVWEEKLEEVEERLREEIPVLTEVKERAIISDSADAPNHILIEGDNLEALTTLSYTHEGAIDVIYIDPPYNTGNKDFIYNDKYVDAEDEYRHSKWLSFMSKRLRIAKRLLSDKGVIFISIDDNEQAQLKLLCDEVFGAENFIASPVRRRRKSQANLSKNISTIHEYVLIYKGHGVHELNKIQANIDLSDYKNPDNDYRGPYKTMPCTNKGGSKYSVVTPSGRIIEEEWRFKEDTYYELLNDNRLVFPKGGMGKPRYKLFLSDKQDSGVIANSWWAELESNQEGATMLKEIMHQDVFNNPKPIGLINFIFRLGTSYNSTILDFFAGSGTTLHATMQLNAEDGGNRKCILVTNNENGICENVTYLRNKKVIEGYTTPKGEEVAGLTKNTLRYYRTEFLPRERSPRNMRALVSLATDLLCIKEDLYTEQKMFGKYPTHPKLMRYFANDKKQMLILYKEEAVSYIVEEIKNMEFNGKLKIYIFTPGRYPFSDDFFEVQDKVELVALPAAIYDAYTRVLPKRKEKYLTPEKEGEATPQTLFNDNEEGEE